jgi:hypothetical protein
MTSSSVLSTNSSITRRIFGSVFVYSPSGLDVAPFGILSRRYATWAKFSAMITERQRLLRLLGGV